MKKCTKCNINKPLTEYYSQNRTRANGEKFIHVSTECKECAKARAIKYQKDNPEKFKGYMKKQNSKPSMKAAKVKISKEFRDSGKYLEWQRNNKDKLINYRENREIKRHNITKDEWQMCKLYFDDSCAYCGLHINEHFIKYAGEIKWTDLHKEHVQHDGANDITNCVPSCKLCNSNKGSMKLEEWYTLDNPVYNKDRLKIIYIWLESFSDSQEIRHSK